jgi:hypothetical protein
MCAFSESGFKELHLTMEATSITHGSGPLNRGEEDPPQRQSAIFQKTWESSQHRCENLKSHTANSNYSLVLLLKRIKLTGNAYGSTTLYFICIWFRTRGSISGFMRHTLLRISHRKSWHIYIQQTNVPFLCLGYDCFPCQRHNIGTQHIKS